MNNRTKRNFLVFVFLIIVCVALVIILISCGNNNAKRRGNEDDDGANEAGATVEPTIDVIQYTAEPIVVGTSGKAAPSGNEGGIGSSQEGSQSNQDGAADLNGAGASGSDISENTQPIHLYVKLETAESKLNIRASASTDSEILGTLSHGKKILLKELCGSWAQIESDETVGYIKTEYMSVAKPK